MMICPECHSTRLSELSNMHQMWTCDLCGLIAHANEFRVDFKGISTKLERHVSKLMALEEVARKKADHDTETRLNLAWRDIEMAAMLLGKISTN